MLDGSRTWTTDRATVHPMTTGEAISFWDLAWSGFYGNLVAAVATVIVALVVVKLTIDEERRRTKKAAEAAAISALASSMYWLVMGFRPYVMSPDPERGHLERRALLDRYRETLQLHESNFPHPLVQEAARFMALDAGALGDWTDDELRLRQSWPPNSGSLTNLEDTYIWLQARALCVDTTVELAQQGKLDQDAKLNWPTESLSDCTSHVDEGPLGLPSYDPNSAF